MNLRNLAVICLSIYFLNSLVSKDNLLMEKLCTVSFNGNLK